MPEQATYADIKKLAEALTDKGKGIYGITLRGKPGWGENMAYVSTLGEHFRGHVVRHGMEGNHRQSGVEKRDYLLCRSDEGHMGRRVRHRTGSTRT